MESPDAAPASLLDPAVMRVAAPSVELETLATGLEDAQRVAFLPDGRALVAERSGRLLLVDWVAATRTRIEGMPPLSAEGTSLLDLLLAPDFAQNGTLFFCYEVSEKPQGRARTVLLRARLNLEARRVEALTTLFEEPTLPGPHALGCRMLLLPTAPPQLLVALGDRSDHALAKGPASRARPGKTLLLDPQTGKGVMGAFWKELCRAKPHDHLACNADEALFTLGHGSIGGLIWHPGSEKPWIIEKTSAQGSDELKQLEIGAYYGQLSLKKTYELPGKARQLSFSARAVLAQWTPSIEPSGMSYLDHDRYGIEWQGALLVGSLKFGELRWLQTVCNRVLYEAKTRIGAGVRDVRIGPDKLIYLLTDGPDAKLLRLIPRKALKEKDKP